MYSCPNDTVIRTECQRECDSAYIERLYDIVTRYYLSTVIYLFIDDHIREVPQKNENSTSELHDRFREKGRERRIQRRNCCPDAEHKAAFNAAEVYIPDEWLSIFSAQPGRHPMIASMLSETAG